jgi:hypothetical protein
MATPDLFGLLIRWEYPLARFPDAWRYVSGRAHEDSYESVRHNGILGENETLLPHLAAGRVSAQIHEVGERGRPACARAAPGLTASRAGCHPVSRE